MGSLVDASRALSVWQEHFGWGEDVWESQGGAEQGESRSGGQPAKWLLLSCLREVHRAKLSGAL